MVKQLDIVRHIYFAKSEKFNHPDKTAVLIFVNQTIKTIGFP